MMFTDQYGNPVILDIATTYWRLAADTDLEYKANAMMFQNTGNTHAIIDNMWTIGPKGTHALGSMTDLNRLKGIHNIKFVNTDNVPLNEIVNRLEICESFTTICSPQNISA